MTPWSFQWTCNFWRLSSPSSILAAHLNLACQIWTCSSEHVKGYVTASAESQHYWRMRYINTKILQGWDHLLLSQFSMGPAKFCVRQLQKNPEASCKKWLLNMPTCRQYFRCCLSPITKASDHATYWMATPRYPATESMSCFICIELLVQTCPEFSITTTSNQTEVMRRKQQQLLLPWCDHTQLDSHTPEKLNQDAR